MPGFSCAETLKLESISMKPLIQEDQDASSKIGCSCNFAACTRTPTFPTQPHHRRAGRGCACVANATRSSSLTSELTRLAELIQGHQRPLSRACMHLCQEQPGSGLTCHHEVLDAHAGASGHTWSFDLDLVTIPR